MHHHRPAPCILGSIHRRIGVLDELKRIGRVFREHRQADRGADAQRFAADDDRRGYTIDQLARHAASCFQINNIG